jgi:hypothetical protein
MAHKIQLTEARLKQIVAESISEVLNEAEEDEGLGRFLGNAYQWARNKAANFKQDFNAARNYQRYKNRDYDPYAPYGDEADKFRNFNGSEYAAYRYNKTAERNRNADQYSREKVGRGDGQGAAEAPNNTPTAPSAPVTSAPNPDAQNANNIQQQNTSPTAPSAPATSAPNNTQPQSTNSAAPAATASNQQQNANAKAKMQKKDNAYWGKQQQIQKLNQQKQNLGKFLMDKGFKPMGGEWIYAKDDSNSNAIDSHFPDIAKAGRDYKQLSAQIAAIHESKLNQIISSAVRKSINENLKRKK